MIFENNGDKFRTIAQSLIQSPVVCGLDFSHCQFRDVESAAFLRSILQNKQKLVISGLGSLQLQR